MKVKELIRRLNMFDPETEVTMTVKEISTLTVKNVDAFFAPDNKSIDHIDLVLE